MSSAVAAREWTRPAFDWSPPSALSSSGGEAVELAESAGLVLDDWQAYALDRILAERADGSWAAFEAAVVVPRQNGKGALLEALSLAGLFLLDEHLILHSAHEFKTAAEGFRRLRTLIENAPHLARRVERVTTAAGNEAIELTTGQRIRYVARSGGSGRGFSGDRVILDEAYALSAEEMAALLPTLSARPNPQVVYTSSAGMVGSSQLRRVRDRGRAGGDPSLCYLEWCAPVGSNGKPDLDDEAGWRAANPGMPFRISVDFVARERRALGEAEFSRERLGVWDEPLGDLPIPMQAWDACADSGSVSVGAPVYGVDASPGLRSAAIVAATRAQDGRAHLEVVEHHPGTDWLVSRMLELSRSTPGPFILGRSAPVAGLLADMLGERLEPVLVSDPDMAKACGGLQASVTSVPASTVHLGDPILREALAGAARRDVGDGGWAWARRRSEVDITPIVAATMAHYGLAVHAQPDYDLMKSFG